MLKKHNAWSANVKRKNLRVAHSFRKRAISPILIYHVHPLRVICRDRSVICGGQQLRSVSAWRSRSANAVISAKRARLQLMRQRCRVVQRQLQRRGPKVQARSRRVLPRPLVAPNERPKVVVHREAREKLPKPKRRRCTSLRHGSNRWRTKLRKPPCLGARHRQ